MKRILQYGLTDNLGGVEAYVYNQFENLDHTRLTYDFLCHMGSEHIAYEKEILAAGGKILHRHHRHQDLIGYYKEIYQIIRQNHYHGIVMNSLDVANASLLVVAKLCGVPVRIIHSHNGGFEKRRLSVVTRMRYWIDKILLRWAATDYFACSELAGKWLFGDNIKFKVIPNAIDCNRVKFNPLIREKVRHELGITPDQFIIGHVARFSRQKNHSFLIDIFREVHRRNPHTVLLLIGSYEGPSREFYEIVKEKVKEYGLEENVRFLGMRADVPRLYQAMDCFVLPSLFEGLPVVGIEAQAAGLPCYFADTVTKEAGITELVQFISLKSAPDVWAASILEKKKDNREKWADIVAKSGYDIHVAAKQIEEYYLSK